MNIGLDEMELRKLLGDDEYDRIASDTDTEQAVPTVVVDAGHVQGDRNVILQFQNVESAKFLIRQLHSMLEAGQELNVTLDGEVTTFGEYCDRHRIDTYNQV